MTAPTVTAAAVEELLAAIHATLPQPEPTSTAPITGTDLVRTLTDALLRRGVDEFRLIGAVRLLRESVPAGVTL